MRDKENEVTTFTETAKSVVGLFPKFIAQVAPSLPPDMAIVAQSLSLAWESGASIRQDQRMRRLERLIGEISAEIDRLGKHNLEGEFFKSQAFLDASEKAAEVCWKAKSDKNVEEAIKLLKTAIRAEEIKIGVAEYMQALSELSEPELVLLKTLYRLQKDHPYNLRSDDSSWYEDVRWKDLLTETGMKSSDHLHFMLNRIARTGFIIQNNPRNLDEVGEKSGTFRITRTLQILMQSLEEET